MGFPIIMKIKTSEIPENNWAPKRIINGPSEDLVIERRIKNLTDDIYKLNNYEFCNSTELKLTEKDVKVEKTVDTNWARNLSGMSKSVLLQCDQLQVWLFVKQV